MEPFLVGIDVGGTFTDCVLVDSDGASTVVKTFTTPEDPSGGVLQGLDKLSKGKGLSLPEFLGRVGRIVHGTTITTNTVITGTGARTGFLTTEGFRDVLLMRQGVREDQFNSKVDPPRPLVPRTLTLTVSERVDRSGTELLPLDQESARTAIQALRRAGVEAVAVSLLFSFLNPEHELQVASLIKEEFPEAYVSLSTEVLPQLGAYRRHSTTALNAYVGPVLVRYLDRLTARLQAAGFSGRLLIMQSNGGVMAPEVASRFACRTLLSGPAGGPVAAGFYGSRAGAGELITMDMGGTSFDVALLRGGQVGTTDEAQIGGHAMGFPVLDIRAVGAGGGSIAWVDAGGVLHVGPQSAGADPGPICYGRGGKEPTVTDADLVLGYLGEEDFLGGEYTLDREKAWQGIQERVAGALGVDPIVAAEGIHKLVNSAMADAIRLVSIRQGYDPRRCTLVVAGGAGPVHAVAIARELGIRTLLVPREASVFCAVGMLLSDLRHDYVRTFSGELSGLSRERVRKLYEEMEAEAARTLREEGVRKEEMVFLRAVDLKYSGQFHEVTIPFAGMEDGFVQLEKSFAAQHDNLYGYSMPGEPVEALHWRLTAIGRTGQPLSWGKARAAGKASAATGPSISKRGRKVIFDGQEVATVVYSGSDLPSKTRIQGPAIVEEPTTTVVVPPGCELFVNEFSDYQIAIA